MGGIGISKNYLIRITIVWMESKRVVESTPQSDSPSLFIGVHCPVTVL